jgi:hypothetical protein
MNPSSNSIVWKYQKQEHLVNALLFRQAPEFVYKSTPASLIGEIPVFVIHGTLPDIFEEQCLHLARNGYKTLSAEEFCRALKPDSTVKKSILLTFDDGLKHVWTIAYPLLRKYNLKATCFLIPGCISELSAVRPTLDDYWAGRASLNEVTNLKDGISPLATWDEITIMHESGVIDFQSHTMYHSLVFTSDEIVDFIHPAFNTYFFGNTHVPLYSKNGADVPSRDTLMGMPIYKSSPRMVAERRFFDDEGVRERCMDAVRNAGLDFFNSKNWRRRLGAIARNQTKGRGRYETVEERDQAIYKELLESKKIIEEKLPNKAVTHLCYPWFDGSAFSVRASRKAGFQLNYFGEKRRKPTNRPGDDPFSVVRINEVFLGRLPGEGRKSVAQTLSLVWELRNFPKKAGLITKAES